MPFLLLYASTLLGEIGRDLVAPNAHFEQAEQPSAADEREKGCIIRAADAIIQPNAVVVEMIDATITFSAVLAAGLHVCLLHVTGSFDTPYIYQRI